jgi:hypothetical protein
MIAMIGTTTTMRTMRRKITRQFSSGRDANLLASGAIMDLALTADLPAYCTIYGWERERFGARGYLLREHDITSINTHWRWHLSGIYIIALQELPTT